VILSQWIDVSTDIFFTDKVGLHLAFQTLWNRPSGLAGTDHAAGFTNMAIALTWGVLASEKNVKRKAFYIILMLYMIYAVILTKSRGALIGLFGAYVFFVYMHSYFREKIIRYSFLFLLLIIFIILLAQPGFIDRILIGFGYTGKLYFSEQDYYHGTEAMTEAGQGLSGLEVRIYWWKNALGEMWRNPFKLLLGLGVGSFPYYSKGSPEVNSISFAFFYDMGVFGVIIFTIFLYILITNLYHYLKKAEKGYLYNILLASLTAFIADPGIHGLVDYDLTFFGSKFFWFPLGFIMAVLKIVKEEEFVKEKQA
jgi:hypothetical protein